jgi:hypothetical protein
LTCVNFATVLPAFCLVALHIWTILAANKGSTFVTYLLITFKASMIFASLVARAFLVVFFAAVENFRIFFDKFLRKLDLVFCKHLSFLGKFF